MNRLATPIGMLVIAVLLFLAGFLSKNTEAFLFPNTVAAVMVVLAIFTIVNQLKTSLQEKTAKPIPWLSILPALIIFIIYLATLEIIGFYLGSFLAFVIIATSYHPDGINPKTTGKVMLIGLLFMAALYCLFSLLLRVQLPRGIFF